MSSVRGVALLNHLSSMGSTGTVRGIYSARWDVWKVLVHALGADAMAEIQRAVLHQEQFDRLPEPFTVAD